MNLKRTVGIVAAIGALGGGAAAVVISTSGAVAEDAPPVRVANAPSQTLPDPVMKAMHERESAVAEFGLDASASRSAEFASGQTIWLTPGKSGSCLWSAESAGSCAGNENIEAGKLVLIELPPIVGKITAETRTLERQPGRLGVIGYAPEGAVAVEVEDASGKVVAKTATTERFYEVHLGAGAGFEAGSGWALRFQLGADREPLRLPL